MNQMPSWAAVSKRAQAMILERDGEWAGVPLPMPGCRIEIESKNPWRDRVEQLNQAIADSPPDVAGDDSLTVVNSWYSRRDQCTVAIVDDGGKRSATKYRHRNAARFQHLLKTMDVSRIWELDTELTALNTLETLITPHLFHAYVMTGIFLETSKRSGLTYIFRRLAPTLVVSPHAPGDAELRLLCALCLHPIAYYQGTHAGAMVPTDDVIAHLLLMRADEHLFWKRANQHDPLSPEANFMF